MKQSYHSYRRRVRLLFRAQVADMRCAVAEWDAPYGFQVLERHKRLLKQARRNFEARRRGV